MYLSCLSSLVVYMLFLLSVALCAGYVLFPDKTKWCWTVYRDSYYICCFASQGVFDLQME